jgi:hypothetical protein
MNTRSIALVAGAIGLCTLVSVETADAGRWSRGGGGVRARGGFSVGVRSHGPRYSTGVRWSRPAHWSRGYHRPRWNVGGSIYVGGGYYPRYRYYRPYYYESYVPSYYGYYSTASYYPVAPAPSYAPAVVAVAARPELPKFGLGLFAGGVAVEDVEESSDIGLLARFRLGNGGLFVEGELGKTSYQDDLRVDRRLGASLVYEIGTENRFAPYVLAGLGVQQAEVAGTFTTDQSFGEIGVGIRYAVTPKFHILADVRAGSRQSVDSDEQTAVMGSVARTVAPPSAESDEGEEYTRARLSALLYF